MTKVKFNEIAKEEKTEILKNLLFILSMAKTKEDLISFMLGGMTGSEIIIFSNRLNIAKKVLEGDTYKKIQEEMNVGPTTIKTTINLLNKNNNDLEYVLKKYFETKKENKDDKFIFVKNKLYNYPGYELAVKLLGIEYIDKQIQKKL